MLGRLRKSGIALGALTIAGALSATMPAYGVVIAAWNFGSAGDFSRSPVSADEGAGTLSWGSDVPAMVVPGDGVSGRALAIRNEWGPGNGKSVLFDLSTLGFADIKMSFDARTSNPGFTDDEVSFAYSSDGVGFTDFTQLVKFSPVDSYGPFNFDFSAVTELNDQRAARFRVTFKGSSESVAFLLMDNVAFTGEPELVQPFAAVANPEPMTLGLAGLGLMGAGLAGCRRRR